MSNVIELYPGVQEESSYAVPVTHNCLFPIRLPHGLLFKYESQRWIDFAQRLRRGMFELNGLVNPDEVQLTAHLDLRTLDEVYRELTDVTIMSGDGFELKPQKLVKLHGVIFLADMPELE